MLSSIIPNLTLQPKPKEDLMTLLEPIINYFTRLTKGKQMTMAKMYQPKVFLRTFKAN